MSFLQSIILGIVEGLTEFLPVSSTGHLVVAQKFMHLAGSDFAELFLIVIQLGAILAVVTLYWKKLTSNIRLWPVIIVAFLPTAAIALTVYPLIHRALGSINVVIIALFLGGLLLILFERWYDDSAGTQDDVSGITYRQAFIIGLAQSIAVIPGVSRSATTICSGLALGLSRRAIVEFSFLLAIPTMTAASGYDLLKNYHSLNSSSLSVLLVGFIVSWLVAGLVIKWLLDFIKRHDFTPFGVYRIIAAIILFLTFK